MNIVAGSLRGRAIPFDNRLFDNADVTPGRVKEAVFSMAGPLDGKSFLDLFGCSGQMGIEAASRGASQVLINERNRERFQFIIALSSKFNLAQVRVMNLSDSVCLEYIRKHNLTFDLIYLDPPYIKKRDEVNYYARLVDRLLFCLALGGEIFIQYYAANRLSSFSEGLELRKERTYGNTSVAVVGRAGVLSEAGEER